MESPHALFTMAINWEPHCYKLQSRWTFNDIHGNQWPSMFETKHKAYEMGMRHRDAVSRRAMEEIREESTK